MAVQNQTPVASFTTSGVTTVFPYAFLLLQASDLIVTLDGVVVTSGFAVSGIGVAGGGNVTFSVAPSPGQTLVLRRTIALQRLTDYQRNGDLLAATLNIDFDRLWQALQGLRQDSTRAIKLPEETLTDQTITDDAATRANKLVGFDASGNAVAVSLADPDTLMVSAFIETLLAAADAAAARATLGAVGLTGAEAIAGVKTFSSAPKIPDASADDEPASKGQLDDVETAAAAALAVAVDPENLAPSLFVHLATVNSTSGTTIDFTGVPAHATEVVVLFDRVSTNGTAQIIAQVGDADGIETADYFGSAIYSGGAGNFPASGVGVIGANNTASAIFVGRLHLRKFEPTANKWIADGNLGRTDSANGHIFAGVKELTAALDRVRVTTVGGANTFDGGQISVWYR